MKRTALAFILLLLAFPLIALAQKDCGDGLPCGKLPWGLPILPVLESPTPMPTIIITLPVTPTVTPNPTATFTPGTPTAIPEPTGSVMTDFSELGNQFSTLQAMVNATEAPIQVSGTPVDPGAQLEVMGADAGSFFGYVRGFSEVSLGGLSPFISFAITAFVVVVGLKAAYYILPIAVAIFGIIIRIVKFIISILGA